MVTTTLKCPACGASDTSKGDDGVHVCAYCHSRYREDGRGGRPEVMAAKPAGEGSVLQLAKVLGLIGVGVGVGIAVVLSFQDGLATRAKADGVRSTSGPLTPSFVPPAVTSGNAPPPEPEASAVFEAHTFIPSNDDMWVLGLYTNTSPYALNTPKVVGVFVDAAGDEVGSDTSYGDRSVVAPGETVPIELLYTDIPAGATLKLEPAASRMTWSPTFVPMHVEAHEPRRDAHGWDFSGVVHNDGDREAGMAHVEIAGWDAEDRLVLHEDTYADGEGVAVGGHARWNVTGLAHDQEPVRFTYVVTARAK